MEAFLVIVGYTGTKPCKKYLVPSTNDPCVLEYLSNNNNNNWYFCKDYLRENLKLRKWKSYELPPAVSVTKIYTFSGDRPLERKEIGYGYCMEIDECEIEVF